MTALDDQLQATFGSFWKSLRYGATLNLVEASRAARLPAFGGICIALLFATVVSL